MTRRDVDRAGAGLHRDKVGGEHDCVAVEKRMSHFDLVDLCARKRLEWFAGRLEFCVRAKLRNFRRAKIPGRHKVLLDRQQWRDWRAMSKAWLSKLQRSLFLRVRRSRLEI